ncbi:MFS transporter [Maritimibacter sp. HL-12]|uniref:MFS transporter n=1 Tax=Maritimibacter sp. HL-12 TaxID=1162418 RepID=UPI000A0F3E5F|nr:MFS transporter [Maritimibacter sp. HL-12]SMH28964.1 Predicted arabinose efflux permease, MFS family [Maritimibacter sp. HL-12]
MSETDAGNSGDRWRDHPTIRLLTRGSFARYSAANFLSLTGSWGQRIAAGWLVWEWTESGFWLGVLAMADLAPVVVIGPFAGVLADRWPRLTVNRVFQTATAILSAVLAVLIWQEMIGLGLLIGLIGLSGIVTSLAQPARLALVQELVPRADVGPAVAINSIKSNLARLVGPAVAATMIVHLDVAWVFFGNAVVTVVYVLVMGWITLLPREHRPLPGGVLAQIADGFRFLLSERALRLVLATNLLGGVLVRSMSELLPAFAARSFADTVTGLALLTSSMAAGAVLAGLTLGRGRSDGAMMRGATGAWAVAALAGLGFGWVVAPWAAVAFIFAVGLFMARGMILTQTFVQLRTPDEMRGRALSVHGLIARSSPAIGALFIGGAVDVFGLPLSVTAAVLIFMLAFAAMRPAVLRQAGPL